MVSITERPCSVRGALHSNPSDAVSRIPETDVSACSTASRRVPRHDQQVEVDQHIEDDRDVPGAELRWRDTELLAAVANDVESDGHGEGEGCGWVGLEVADEIEGIPCWRSEDHDHCYGPFDKVWAEWCTEWLF